MFDIAELQKLEISADGQEYAGDEPLLCGPPCTYFSSLQ